MPQKDKTKITVPVTPRQYLAVEKRAKKSFRTLGKELAFMAFKKAEELGVPVDGETRAKAS